MHLEIVVSKIFIILLLVNFNQIQYSNTRASAEKFPGEEGQWKNQDREIALISLLLLYQCMAS